MAITRYQIKSGDRLFEQMHCLCVIYASIGVALRSVAVGFLDRPPMGVIFSSVGSRNDFLIGIPIHGVVELTLQNVIPNEIVMESHDVVGENTSGHQINTTAKILDSILVPNFIWYYEVYENEMRAKYGKDFKMWPSEWIFAWCIRNALAHNNKIHFRDLRHPGASWKLISITPDMQGNQLMPGICNGADLIMLMLEMDKYLENLPNQSLKGSA